MAADKAQQETASNGHSHWKEILETACAVLWIVLLCSKHLLSLWVMAGTSFSPKIVDTEVNPKWEDVIKYGCTDNVAYYFDYSPIPTDKECFAIDLYLRGFKEKKRNSYEIGCSMIFPNYPDSIVKGNRLVVYLHNGDSAVAKSYVKVRHPHRIQRTSRRQTRSLKAERHCSYTISKKNLSKLLQNTADSIKVESANGQIVRPASKKANIRLQQRYYLVEEYLNEFQYTMKKRNQ